MYIAIYKPVELIAAKKAINTVTGEEYLLDNVTKDLWCLLLAYKNAYGTGNIYPTHEQLADNLDVTEYIIRKNRDVLKAMGAIKITEHKKGVKGISKEWQQCNHSYSVTAPAYLEGFKWLDKDDRVITDHYFIPHYKRPMRKVT